MRVGRRPGPPAPRAIYRGNRIQALMDAEGLTSLEALAARVGGLHFTTLGLVRSGKLQPSLRIIDRFRLAFPEYSVEWLFPELPRVAEKEKEALA